MVSILGGGISGLSAGYYLLQRFGQPLTIYESSNRVGGWIRSERHNDKGFIFEVGPRTIRPKGLAGAYTLQMIEELQLSVDGIPASHSASRNRMIYAKGQLCLLPNNLFGVFKTHAPFSKPLLSAMWNDLLTDRKQLKSNDESVYDFVQRRFGDEIARYGISPMICGICAGDAKEISVRFLMEDIFEKEQRWGGVIKGMLFHKFLEKKNNQSSGIFAEPPPTLFKKALREKWSMYRTANGLETLPHTLGAYLRTRDVNIKLSAECREIFFTRNAVKINVKDQAIETNYIISSLPAHKLANCVKNQHPSLASQLLSIPYVDVAVVNLQYNKSDLLKTSAFGFLVPPIEKLPILGVIFDSCCFEMHGNTVLTVMMGGRWFKEYFGVNPSQKELLDTALQQISRILGINCEPKMTRVHVLRKCIPQYTVGHKQRVADIRNYIKRYKLPISLCGAAYDGVGVNDVILSARRQVEALPTVENFK